MSRVFVFLWRQQCASVGRFERMERTGATGHATWWLWALVCFVAPPLLRPSSDVVSVLCSSKHRILAGSTCSGWKWWRPLKWLIWDHVLVKGEGPLCWVQKGMQRIISRHWDEERDCYAKWSFRCSADCLLFYTTLPFFFFHSTNLQCLSSCSSCRDYQQYWLHFLPHSTWSESLSRSRYVCWLLSFFSFHFFF